LEDVKEILRIIKDTAGEFIPDSEVMLFGSKARGDSNSDSDYDILIITSQDLSTKAKFPLRTSIRVALLKKGIRSDILIQGKNEIERKKKLPGHFIKNIFNEAIML